MELRTLRYYLAAAEEIVELADRLEEAFIARNADVSGVISIGATEAVGSRMFAKLIKQFSDKYPLVQFHLFNEMADYIKERMESLNIPLSYTLLSNAVLLVEAGLGCAFCLDGALAIHSSPQLRFIPIRPEHTTRSVLVWKKNHLFSPATSLFIQEINMLRANMKG